MKRLIALALLCTLPGLCAAPQNVIVKHKAAASFALLANTKAAGSGATSAAIDTTGANLLVAVATAYGTAPTVPNDSKGNVWVACGTEAALGNSHIRIFYVASPTVGTGHQFTAMASGYPTLFVSAWSGAAASSPCDQTNKATNRGTAVTVGSITPTLDNELVITGVANNTSDASHLLSIDGGFTRQDEQTSSSYEGLGWAYLIQTTAAAAAPTWNTHTSTDDLAAVIACFKRG